MAEDDETKAAYLRGIEQGKLNSKVDNHGLRLSRLEKALLTVITCIVAAWAKARGLY